MTNLPHLRSRPNVGTVVSVGLSSPATAPATATMSASAAAGSVSAARSVSLDAWGDALTDALALTRAQWVGLALFVLIIALLGGSSRFDIGQLVPLRALSALFLIPALYTLTFAKLRSGAMVCTLLGLMAAWMAVQLVPLPPELHRALYPDSLLLELDTLIGLEGNWRPISWVPTRGWNALAAMIVPVAAALLVLGLRVPGRALLMVLVAIGLADATVGIAQIISGGADGLYLYSVRGPTNDGLFANPNHSVVFSALTMLIALRLGLEGAAQNAPQWMRIACAVTFILCLISMLISGSRMGFALALAVTFVSAAMAYTAIGAGRMHAAETTGKTRKLHKPRGVWAITISPRMGLALGALGAGAVIATFVGLERAPGYETFFTESAFEGLRWRLTPILQSMIAEHGVLGIGFGAFEEVYHIYEPTELLRPQYINQAHNDWAQLALEGGVPALGVLVALLVWIGAALRGWIRQGRAGRGALLFWGAVFAIFAGASLVDYPLRTPLFQMASIWLLLVFTFDRRAAKLGREKTA